MHLRLSGDLPHVVLGWRTHPQFDDVPDVLIAVYGPVPTPQDAEQLITTLVTVLPASEENYSVMPLFAVQMGADPTGSEATA